MIIVPSCCMCVHLPFSAENRAVTMQDCLEIEERSSESVKSSALSGRSLGFKNTVHFYRGSEGAGGRLGEQKRQVLSIHHMLLG